MAKGIIASIFALLFALAVLRWSFELPNYFNCLNDKTKDKNNCLKDFLMLHPSIQEAQELKDACKDPNSLNCTIVLGQKIVEEKLSE